MRKSTNFWIPLLAIGLLLAAGAGTVLASGDSGPAEAGMHRPAAPDASMKLDREVWVRNGEILDDFLRAAGHDEESVQALRRRQRAEAIRQAYATGNERAIAAIEESVPAAVIESALSADGEDGGTMIQPKGLPDTAYVYCSAGQGASAQFKVRGFWGAHWVTSTGSRTSQQEGFCSDFDNGCVIGDTIGGNPSISWRRHRVTAYQLAWHNAWCN